MLIVQLLLPRFLVVEIVLFIHFMQGQACNRVTKEPKECKVPFNGTIRNEPLILKDQDYLMPNNAKSIIIEDNALVICPGAKFFDDENHMDVKCSRSGLIRGNNDHPVNVEDLDCSRSIQESIQSSNQVCGPESKGQVVEVGWEIPALSRFKSQFSVCHNRALEHTYYTEHVIRGSHISNRLSDKYRPRFKEGRGFYTKDSANDLYRARIRIMREEGGLNNIYSRGHLTPNADFVLNEMQDATFYYFNAIPQWSSINGGNWNALEQSIRNLASKLNQDVQVQTGPWGLNGYLGNNTIPIPKYVWKLVVADSKAIAFVITNFVQDDNESEIEDLCPDDQDDLCEETLWIFPHRTEAQRGRMYCCTYQSIQKSIPWIKHYDNVGLLTNII